MKNSGTSRVCIIVAILSVLCPTMALADMSVVLYDNFDDGNYNGWANADHIPSPGITPPSVVSSPEGLAIAGVASRVTPITHPLDVTGAMEVSFEMRATSGWGVDSTMILWAEADYPTGALYGGYSYERRARFVILYDGIERIFDYGGITGWHDFKWARDAQGWWSFYLDGSNVYPNFVRDSHLTSFTHFDLGNVNGGSQIEWVRVSAEAVPLPGAVLLGTIGLGFANYVLRRRSAP